MENILIVDNNPEILKSVKLTVNQIGFKIFTT